MFEYFSAFLAKASRHDHVVAHLGSKGVKGWPYMTDSDSPGEDEIRLP